MNKRDQILQLLSAFASQRPGLEYDNYGDPTSYRSEMRSITADLHTFRRLLAAVSWRSSIGEPELREAFKHAYSGRLTLEDRPDGKLALDYCTGQYFPTEYRKACCAVLAAALWDHAATDLDKREYPNVVSHLREEFRKEFGRGIQSRYFD